MNRRKLLSLLATSSAVAGCANSIMGRSLAKAFETSLGSSAAFDPAYPESLPYASIAVSLKNQPKALLVLAKAEQGELHWLSSDRGALVTRNGRLVRTVGLPENLVHTEFLGVDFFDGASLPRSDVSIGKRLVDISPGNRYGMVVEATLMRGPEEKTVINGHVYDTTVYTERCIAPGMGWEFANTYWISRDGAVWRSLQHVAPGVDPLEIEVTKPYRT